MREHVTPEEELDECLWTYRAQINWHDCPHLKTPANLRVRKALIKLYGIGSGFIRSFLNGEFFRQDDANFVFTEEDLDHIRVLMKEKSEGIKTGKLRLAADVSGGGDAQIIYGRDGSQMIYSRELRETSAAKLAEILVDVAHEFGVQGPDFYIDNGGLGKAVIDSMEDNHKFFGVHRYMNNQKSYYQAEWSDRITQDHYLFKQKVWTAPVGLLNDPILRKQMRARQFVMDDHHKVKLEPKKLVRKRKGEAMDRLDTVVMLFADFDPPKEPPKQKEKPYVSKLEAEADGRQTTGAFSGVRTMPGVAHPNHAGQFGLDSARIGRIGAG